MIPVFISRYSQDLKNGENVDFKIGERVLFKPRREPALYIRIASERKIHESGYVGYEAIYSDDGGRYFAPAIGIIDWEGKGMGK
jgi:hypothetical protein